MRYLNPTVALECGQYSKYTGFYVNIYIDVDNKAICIKNCRCTIESYAHASTRVCTLTR